MLLETRGARDLGRHRKQERGLGRRNQLCRLWASELGGVCVCPDVTRRPGHVALSPRAPWRKMLGSAPGQRQPALTGAQEVCSGPCFALGAELVSWE